MACLIFFLYRQFFLNGTRYCAKIRPHSIEQLFLQYTNLLSDQEPFARKKNTMPTIDNLGERISIDYLRSLEDVQAIRPLLRISPAIYVPTQMVVHSLQPWAFFQPPPNFTTGIKKLFLNQTVIPAVESIDTDEDKKKKFEMIACEDDEEEEEKETIERMFVMIKHLNSTLRVIAEQTIQYAHGPLDVTKGQQEDDAKYHSLVENRKTAYTYVRRGKFRFSLPYLEAIVAEDPKSHHDLQTLGAVYVHVYRPEDAVVVLKKCLEIDPSDALSQLNLAKAYFDLNRIPEGIDTALPLRNNTDIYVAQNAIELVEQYLAAVPQSE
jgi:tetratricopeptide (TPR) repeat protein